MKRSFGVLLILIGILIAFATLIQPLFQSSRTSTVNERGVNVDGIQQVMMKTSVADLNIESYSGDELLLEVKGNASNYRIDISEKSNSRLDIEINSNKRWFFFFNVNNSSSVSVFIPETYTEALNIENTVGDISFLTPLTLSELNIKTTAGNVERLSGTIDTVIFNGTAGDFQAYDLLTKEADLKGTAGDIYLEMFTGDVIGKNTVGDIYVEFAKENGNMDLQTSAGDIRIKIPEPSFELDASTSLGDITIQMPITLEQSGKTYRGVVKNGDRKVKVSTSLGDIKID